MTSLLLPSSATLLAYKRLVDCVESLQRKVVADVFDVGFFSGAENVRVNAVERQVLGLARAAQGLFEAGPKADLLDAPHGLQVGQGLSRFAVLGSAGFELRGLRRRLRAGRRVAAERDPARHTRPEPEPRRRRHDPARGPRRRARARGDLGRRRARPDPGVLDGPALERRLRGRREPRPARAAGEADEARVEPPLARRGRRGRREPCSARAARRHRRAPGAGSRGGPQRSDVPDALFTGFAKALEETYGSRRAPAARLRRLRGRLRRGRPDLRDPAARRATRSSARTPPAPPGAGRAGISR